MIDWQPIETAPRDGTGMLAYNPMVGVYHTAFTTRWTGDPGEYEARTYEGFPCGFWASGPGGYPFGKWDCRPTHWMPLPAPPVAREPTGEHSSPLPTERDRSRPGGDKPIQPPTAEPSEKERLTDKPARLIVCGGRDFNDYARVAAIMDRLQAIRPIAMVFHGNARGADSLADRWCRERGVKVFPVPAEWSKHGKRAGPLRNQAMLGHSIDLVVAFPGGAGTEDMVRRAHKAGVMVTRARAQSPAREA